MKAFVFAAGVWVALAGSAGAQEERQVVAAAGKRTTIASVGVFWAETCHAGGGNPRVTSGPSNGRAEITRGRVKNNNRSAACMGVDFDGHLLVYTPRGGYRGSDTITVTVDVFNGRVEVPRTFTYAITVK